MEDVHSNAAGGEVPAALRRRRWVSGISIAVFVLLSVAVTYFVGIPLVRSLEEPSRFRDFIESGGFWGRAAFVGIVVLQLFVALIPGGPLEVAGGYAYGWFEGALLYALGTVLGVAVVLLFVRRFGMKAVEVFYSRDRINSLSFIRDEKRLDALLFFLYLIPGTPKDAITYFAGLTPITTGRFLLLTTLARLPAIVTSTLSGDALIAEDYATAAALFIALSAVSIVGAVVYARYARTRTGKK
ncbi:MAG: VTT domain-containing protein [Oscillospiraceae bacterium]|nr:VTT domain-containing protein [Oscillospiraceae bacterium]